LIKITFENEEGVMKTLGGSEKMIQSAIRSAITRTTKKFEQDIEAKTSQDLDIPKTALAKYRVKSKRLADTGFVWMGYNPIKSGYIKSLKQEDWGASARSYLFKGGFVAQMKSGHKGIYLRVGPKRLMTSGLFAGKKRQPIAEERVSILKSPAIVREVMPKVAAWYQAELAKAIAKSLNP